MTGDPNGEAPGDQPDQPKERPAPDAFVAIAAAVSPRAKEAIAARDLGARLPEAGDVAAPPHARSLRTRLKAAARRALSSGAADAQAAPEPTSVAPPSSGEALPSPGSAQAAPEAMRAVAPAPQRRRRVVARTLGALVVAFGALGTIAWLTLGAQPDGPVQMTVSAVAPTVQPLRRRALGVAPPARGLSLAATFAAPPPLRKVEPPPPGAAPWVGPADVQGAPRIARLPAPRPTARARD